MLRSDWQQITYGDVNVEVRGSGHIYIRTVQDVFGRARVVHFPRVLYTPHIVFPPGVNGAQVTVARCETGCRVTPEIMVGTTADCETFFEDIVQEELQWLPAPPLLRLAPTLQVPGVTQCTQPAAAHPTIGARRHRSAG